MIWDGDRDVLIIADGDGFIHIYTTTEVKLMIPLINIQ
jgi:acyl-homoserine lactone acylase PvdQ